ncbi:MAG: hypothetical protein M9916_10245 [Crocinitomicaceae bacterium]|nr:hypothetical protein [Crocinitomicaceae bacterium]
MVGIGNFSSNGQNTAPADAIDAKLDIDGDLRIRTVTQNNSLTRVLVIDENDHNRVHYADIDLPVSNGFTECADTNGAANLLADSKVNLNDYNLYFLTKEQTPLLDKNRVGIGYDCSDNLLGKLSVLQRHYQSVAENTFGGHFSNIDIAAGTSGIGYDFTGVYGEAIGMQPDGIKAINNGGMFFANNASINYGVSSFATRDVSSPNHIGHINIGGVFTGTNGKGQSIGIRSTGSNSDIRNYGVD